MAEAPQSPAQRKLVHVAVIPVRWGDMDIHSHVNNTVYFRYLEQARIEWFDSVRDRAAEAPFGIVVANAYCNFLRPIHYPATLEVLVYACPPGRSSFELQYDVHPAGDRSRKYADGYTRMVWIDRRDGRSAPLPGPIRALLS